MTIGAINVQFEPIQPVTTPGTKGIPSDQAGGEKSFSQVLGDALREVDQLQSTADQQIEGLTVGKEGVTTHGALLALEKADVAFQLMNSIRTKIIRAYEEVIRTQV